ncbi:MAG: hypothetical protein NVSMB38_40030 [Ktedonobacteraceae bacterium]
MSSFPEKLHIWATEITMEERSTIIGACDEKFSVKTIPGTLASNFACLG